MVVISPVVGKAMLEQVERVNGQTPDADVYRQLDEARVQIRELQDRLAQYQFGTVAPIAGAHGALTTPVEFARMHGVSVSTVNRALNANPPVLKGERQPNNRWLVYADQPYTKKRG